MLLTGTLLVFFAMASFGTLVFGVLRFVRQAERLEELHLLAQEEAERRHRERLDHANALATVVTDQVRLIGAALAAEVRESAAARRNDLRLAAVLPPVRVPGEAPPTTPPSRVGFSRTALNDNEPTPPSGWTLEQIRAPFLGREGPTEPPDVPG